jgi:hypothetical protein
MPQDELPLTGGCQCGAVRYEVRSAPFGVHVCHCRMCQKAVGGPFAVICPVLKADFRLTRGAMAHFWSSDVARRGFCQNCGTPMTFEYPDAPDLGLLVGTFDHPDRIAPEIQYGIESRLPWYGHLPQLPGDRPTYAEDPAMLARISGSNHQHPDHATESWPPRDGDGRG